MPALTAPKMIRLTPRRPPAVRPYAPKPLDPGQAITWAREIPGYWTGATWGDGTWIPGDRVTRTGVIWSAGPHPRSLWVTPDDAPGYPVLVSLPTPKRAEAGDGPAEIMSAELARAATRRGENLRRHGAVFAVLEEVRRAYGRYGCETEVLSYHCDPDCPHAAGKDRRPASDDWGYSGYPFRRVLAIVTGAETDGCSPSLLCQSCLWLQPAEARELVNA